MDGREYVLNLMKKVANHEISPEEATNELESTAMACDSDCKEGCSCGN